MFYAQVGGKFAALNITDSDINTLADDVKKVLVTAAKDVLGRWRKKKQPWVSNETQSLWQEVPKEGEAQWPWDGWLVQAGEQQDQKEDERIQGRLDRRAMLHHHQRGNSYRQPQGDLPDTKYSP